MVLLVNCILSLNQRVDCMRLRHEFVQGYDYLRPAMLTIRDATQGCILRLNVWKSTDVCLFLFMLYSVMCVCVCVRL